MKFMSSVQAQFSIAILSVLISAIALVPPALCSGTSLSPEAQSDLIDLYKSAANAKEKPSGSQERKDSLQALIDQAESFSLRFGENADAVCLIAACSIETGDALHGSLAAARIQMLPPDDLSESQRSKAIQILKFLKAQGWLDSSTLRSQLIGVATGSEAVHRVWACDWLARSYDFGIGGERDTGLASSWHISAAAARGVFKGDNLSISFKPEADGTLSGTIRLDSGDCPFKATVQDEKLHGTFTSQDSQFTFVASVKGDQITIESGGVTSTLNLEGTTPDSTGAGHATNPIVAANRAVPADLDFSHSIAIGRSKTGRPHFLVLRPDGGVTAWGDECGVEATVPAGLTDVVAVSAGMDHSMALRKDGTVVAWGNVGNVPEGLHDVIAIHASRDQNTAMLKNGQTMTWDQNGSWTEKVRNCIDISSNDSNENYTLYLHANGTLAQELSFSDDAFKFPEHTSDYVAIAVGQADNLGLCKDGTVKVWGDNNILKTALPSGMNEIIAIAADSETGYAVKRDGTLIQWGTKVDVPAEATGIVSIVAVDGEVLAVRKDGVVIAWGYYANTMPAALRAGSANWTRN